MIRVALCLLLLALPVQGPAMAQAAPPPKPGDAPRTGCASVTPVVVFCGESRGWQPLSNAANPAVDGYWMAPDGLVEGLVIVENLGRRNGVTIDGVQRSALEILRRAPGGDPSAARVLSTRSIEVAGYNAPTLIYTGRLSTGVVTYANSMVLRDDDFIQLITARETTTYTAEHEAAHLTFLAEIGIPR